MKYADLKNAQFLDHAPEGGGYMMRDGWQAFVESNEVPKEVFLIYRRWGDVVVEDYDGKKESHGPNPNLVFEVYDSDTGDYRGTVQ